MKCKKNDLNTSKTKLKDYLTASQFCFELYFLRNIQIWGREMNIANWAVIYKTVIIVFFLIIWHIYQIYHVCNGIITWRLCSDTPHCLVLPFLLLELLKQHKSVAFSMIWTGQNLLQWGDGRDMSHKPDVSSALCINGRTELDDMRK